MTERLIQLSAGIHSMEGASNFHFELFGNDLAVKNSYNEHKGIEAIRFYLMCKYGWLPSSVRSMSLEDLKFAMAEEMHGWTMPSEAKGAYPYPEFSIDGKPAKILE